MMDTTKTIVYGIAGLFAVLSVLSFLTLLPVYGEFLLHLLSVLFLCLLLARSHLSKIIFGEEKPWVCWSILGVCVLLSLHGILTTLLEPLTGGFLYALIGALNNSIDDGVLYGIGIVLIAVLSVVFTLKIKVKAPSVMAMLGEKGEPKHLDAYTIRSIVTFFTVIAFYILVFDILLQWAGIIGGSATIIAIVAVLFTAIIHQSTEHMSFRRFAVFIEDLDERIFGGLIDLFHSRITVFFGVAALLVFYPLSDLGAFVLPYVTNIPNSIILHLPLASHTPLPVLAYRTALSLGGVTGFFAAIAYILDGLAAIMILFMPALFWYRVFTKKTMTISPWASAVFVGSVICFLVAPAMSLARLSETSTTMVGVDVMTHSLTGAPVTIAVILGIIAGVIVWLVARKHPTQVSIAVIGFTLVFLARYMIAYFADVWSSLLQEALAFLHVPSGFGLLDGFLFLCFLAISAIFYIGSLAVYFYEIWVSLWHEHHKKVRKVWSH